MSEHVMAREGLFGDVLVVVVHAYGGSPKEMQHVTNAICAKIHGAELMRPELPLGYVSFADPNVIVANLLIKIDQRWRERQRAHNGSGYQQIILVGYSIGGLLARKLYVAACGEDPRAPLEAAFHHRDGFEWAARVERIILLAGINRGWRISHHLNMWRAIQWQLGSMILTLLAIIVGSRPLIFSVRRGAPFITQLRIQWIRMRQRSAASTGQAAPGQALTVQLLGSIDDFVAPTDNIDLISGGDFAYLDVPSSGHVTVAQMDNTPAGRARRTVFERALTEDKKALLAASLMPQDDPRSSADDTKSDVVFVVHGIRDEGYWTHKIARKVLERARADGRLPFFATETASYGYFPMLPFLLSWRRREKIEWLMDQYAGAIARYPNARFHYIGHSNGTYSLAQALLLYPCCRFDRVVFAGSVVRRSFEWDRFLPNHAAPSSQAQVRQMLNYVASADWVVAGFPKLFEYTRWVNRDLGGAGHDGFTAARDNPDCAEIRFIRGGHGAAIQESNWDAVAEFVYSGKAVEAVSDAKSLTRHHDLLVGAIGAFPPVAWLAAAIPAIVVAGVVGVATFCVAVVGIEWLERLAPVSVSLPLQAISSNDAAAATLALVAAVSAVTKGLMKL